jgi:hypothetical protein
LGITSETNFAVDGWLVGLTRFGGHQMRGHNGVQDGAIEEAEACA